ncbi:MAG: NAD(P)-dependent oxidoreductase [Lachnoclostridium sp.]|nr:NAD(P)-dependent oxidoreductase [Lachnoclostridium sp.]
MATLLATSWVPEEILESFRDTFDTIQSPVLENTSFSRTELFEYLPQADALFALAGVKCDRELIDAGCKLKVICNLGVGYDNIDVQTCTERNIAVINTPSAVCESTAEYTIALMMTLCRGTMHYDQFARENKRTESRCFLHYGMLLYGKTLGILGFGRIGQAVARKAKGLGMNIIYYSPSRKPEAEEAIGATYCSFEEVLQRADVVSCHMPYTPKNHYIMNEHTFSLMKNSAYFINAARGPIADEKALIAALKNGIIAGAAVDVYEQEPAISEELTKLENIVLGPHIASNVYETRSAMAKEALGGACAILKGVQPPNLVNPK